MKLDAVRPLAALFVALGLVLAVDSAPVSAQDATPWYMPQPWVTPPQTGPQIRKLPGNYGYRYRNHSYGSFAKYCYGDCGYRAPGTISTGGGVVLKRPALVSYDQDQYMIVPRTLYEAPQPAVQRKGPTKPAVVPANQLRGYKPKPTVRMQNGVRVIQLTPLTAGN